MYMCELNELKEQLSTRDRTIIEVNNELECVRQQMTQLSNNYQTVLHQQQLAQHALYVASPHTAIVVYCVSYNVDSRAPSQRVTISEES